MQHLLLQITAPERRAVWRLALAVLLVAVTTLALLPHPPAAVTTGWDKSNHALAFGSLAFSSVWALWRRPQQWGVLVIALLAYGGAIEIAQTFLPPRSGEWADLLADGVGIALGLAVAWPVTRLQRR